MPVGQVLLEDRQLQRQGGPGQSGHGVSDDDGDVAGTVHAHAQAVGRFRGFAHRLDVQPEGGAVDHEPQGRNQQKGHIHQHVLLEKRLSYQGQVAEDRNREVAQAVDGGGGSHLLLEEQVADAQAEDEDTDPADALLRLERQGYHAVDHPHERSYHYPHPDADQNAVGAEGGVVGTVGP